MIWRPKNITYEGVNYYPLGDIIVGPTTKNGTIQAKITYSALQLNSKITTAVVNTYLVGGEFVAPPVDYTLLWTNKKIWIWRAKGPITEDGEYIALGDIATASSNKPSIGESAPIRCLLKSALNQVKTPQKMLWSTQGSSSPPAKIFGFCANDGTKPILDAADNNAYNLFRLAPNSPSSIPLSDTMASFYSINSTNYDINDQPGKLKGKPYAGKDNQNEGKGWMKNPSKESKYSILAYLNLKPTMTAKSRDNSTILELQNNISFGNSNSYMIKYKGRCLEVVDGAIVSKLCNMAKAGQCFRVEMTGKEKGQFRLVHITTGTFLETNKSKFRLVDTANNDCIYNMQ
jgi:hypothetical protein